MTSKTRVTLSRTIVVRASTRPYQAHALRLWSDPSAEADVARTILMHAFAHHLPVEGWAVRWLYRKSWAGLYGDYATLRAGIALLISLGYLIPGTEVPGKGRRPATWRVNERAFRIPKVPTPPVPDF